MSVKSQLNASRDFLLTGMRAAARVQTQNPNAEKVLRGAEEEAAGLVGSALVEATVEWIE